MSNKTIFAFSRNVEKDLEKLSQAFFGALERKYDGEYGAIGTDCKRPFGNSDVDGDILEIIGAFMEGDDGDSECWSSGQRAYAADLYNSLPSYLRKKYLTDKEMIDRFYYRLEKEARS